MIEELYVATFLIYIFLMEGRSKNLWMIGKLCASELGFWSRVRWLVVGELK
eukprot:JP439641.1.p5 GENE.JP439641.1~~JP439641.1.p5  ORF type:complete len:51 (-),score=2.28 JP439641.1:1-153(-)